MEFEVLKPFGFAGQQLTRGQTVEIPETSPKIGPLARAKFIRLRGEAVVPQPEAEEKEAEPAQPPVEVAVGVSEDRVEVNAAPEAGAEQARSQDPKQVIREAKAKASAKKTEAKSA